MMYGLSSWGSKLPKKRWRISLIGYLAADVHTAGRPHKKWELILIEAICSLQALTLDATNVEALLMKATAFLELKKMQEAIQHFQAAIRQAPVRFEAYAGKVLACFIPSQLRNLKRYTGVSTDWSDGLCWKAYWANYLHRFESLQLNLVPMIKSWCWCPRCILCGLVNIQQSLVLCFMKVFYHLRWEL